MFRYAKYLFLLIYIFGVFLISYEALKDGNESSNISNNVADIVGGAVDQIGGVVDQIGGAIGGGSNNENSGSINQPGGETDNQEGNLGESGGSENQGGNSEESGGSENQGGNSGESSGSDNQGGNSGESSGSENPGGNSGESSGNENQGGNVQEPDGGNEDILEPEPHEHEYVNGNCECGEKDPRFITRYNFDITKFRYVIRKLVGHFGAFVFLGLFASLTYFCFIKRNKLLALLITIGAGIIVAAGSELLQFIPDGRYPAFKDVLIDMAGYMCATLVFSLVFYLPYYIKRIINKRKVESN